MMGAEPDSFPEGEGTDAGFSEVDGRAGAETDSSPEAEVTDAVEAEESTERREGVDGVTGKMAPGATRAREKGGRRKECRTARRRIRWIPHNIIPLLPANCRDFEQE